MNERLKELEKQSIITIETREISGAWDNDRPPFRYVTTTETKFSPEKFAELVIKETMQVVAKNVAWNSYLNAAEAVIEHFKDEE
jgi:hypothetical protein